MTAATRPVWLLVLPYLKPPLTLNDRRHWAKRASWSRQIRQDVWAIAHSRLYALPKGLDRVHVTLHWQPTVNRHRDSDNPTPTLKAAIDGLRDYGLVADDSSQYVSSNCVIEPVGDTARVWLTITDMS